jgi:signal peptidase I
MQPIESSLRRGEIVSFVHPRNPDEWLIKRVIGLPGDLVKTYRHKRKFVIVPPGHCWIEGDNYAISDDSNRFGCVSMGLVQGKARAYLRWHYFESWPLFRFPWFGRFEMTMPAHRRIKILTQQKGKQTRKDIWFVDFKDVRDPSDKFDDEFEDDDEIFDSFSDED